MTTDLLFKNFHLLADTPGGVKKLRELILQLAVQGRLVPQNPDDEPASVLLEKIREEKNRLIREGKIKQQKPLPEIRPEEVPYELPEGWKWARLKNISFDLGQKKPDMEFTYIDVASIENTSGKVSRDLQVIQPQNAPSRARKIVHKNTVIFSTVRPYLLNIAVIEDDYFPEPIASTAFAILHPCSGISSMFLFYFLRSNVFIDYVNSKMTGIAYPAINDSNFFSGPIPIPPSSEQHRIVAKVDQLMSLCDELEARQEKQKATHVRLNKSVLHALTESRTRDELSSNWTRIKDNFNLLFTTSESIQELRSSILQLAVQGRLVSQIPEEEPASVLLEKIREEKKRLVQEGKIKKQKPLPEIKPDEVPFELPKGWEWVRLGDHFDVRDGTHDTPKYTNIPNGYPLITSKNLCSGKLDFSTVKYISEDDHKKISVRSKVENRDVLFAMIGTIGNPVIVETTRQFSIKNVALFKYYNIELTSPKYLKYFLQYAAMQMREQATGGVQAFVSLGLIRRYLFPLPPLPEQYRIVAKVDHLMTFCDELESDLSQSQTDGKKLMEAVMAQLSAASNQQVPGVQTPRQQSGCSMNSEVGACN